MGFEINRFVDSVNPQFICSICNGVLQEPIMIKECQHFFCTDCIRNVMKTTPVCPKHTNIGTILLSFSQLIEPQNLILNLLNDLKIKCEFESNGCKEVVGLGQLDRHRRSCERNPMNEKLMKCFCGQELAKNELNKHKQNCLPFIKNELSIYRLQISTFMADINIQCSQKVSTKHFSSETEFFYHRLNHSLPQRSRNQSYIQNILLYLNWRLLNYKSGSDEHIRHAFRDLIIATESNSEALREFNRLDGLDYVLLTKSLTKSRDINQSISRFLCNFQNSEIPLKQLMEKQSIDLLLSLLDPSLNGIETSFNCVDLLSKMVVKFNHNWNELSSTNQRKQILNRLKTTISGWKLNEKLIKYKTLDKVIDQLVENVDSMPPEVQLRYVWIFVHHSRDEPKKYVPMIGTKNTMQFLNKWLESDKTEPYIKNYIQLLFYQIETFNSLGHLNGLENSDKRDFIKT